MCRKKTSMIGDEGCHVRRRRMRRAMKATVLWWLIDVGLVQENVQVISINEENKQMKRRGRVKREGIECMCCNQVFSVKNFHVHNGGNGRNCGRAYESTFIVETQVSLMGCMLEAWKNAEESQWHKFNRIETTLGDGSDIYDDACMVCADGGDLMCCDKCNSTYHPSCMDMEDVPEDSWHCPYCVCKFCEKPALDNDYLFKCPQCAKRYHWECHQMRESKMDLNISTIAPFCERSCKKICDKLRKSMIGKINEIDGGYSWSLLHQMVEEFDVAYTVDKYIRVLCHSKLAVARRLMEECFELIQDRYTKIKVIPAVVYNCGSNFTRINFEGFYTVVLEKDGEIISVASIRIHGTKLAEMPFIATSEAYRSKGMCRKLMAAIESALCFLNVENLIIPSVLERIENWTGRYGFRPLDLSMKKEIMLHNTLMFHDSVRLQKVLSSSSHLSYCTSHPS
ncbi:hypothetical protein ACS0TY_001474 [Phlomoides rotata]